MRYTIIAKTGVKRPESVQEADNGALIVTTHSKPMDGEANKSIITLLSRFLNIPKTRIKIISGIKSKTKIVEVLDN